MWLYQAYHNFLYPLQARYYSNNLAKLGMRGHGQKKHSRNQLFF